MVYEVIVVTLLLPAVVSAAAVLLELLAGGSRRVDHGQNVAAWIAGGVAAAGSYLLAYWLYSWTQFDATDYWHWLPQAVLAITLTALLAASACRAWGCAIVVPVVLVYAWLMTPGWDDVVYLRPWVALGLATAMLTYLMLAWPAGDARRAKQAWIFGVGLTLHLVAATIIVERSGWASLAQLSVVPIVVFSVLTVTAWLWRDRPFLYGAIPMFAVSFPAVLLLAWYGTFSPISIWAFGTTALGPLALLASLAMFPRPSLTSALLAVAISLVFPMVGVTIAISTTS